MDVHVNTLRRLAPLFACGSLLLPFAGIATCNTWAPHAVHMEEAMQSAAIGGLFCAAAAILGVLTLFVATRWRERVVAAIGIVAGAGIIASAFVL